MAEDLMAQITGGTGKLPAAYTVTDPYQVLTAQNVVSVDLMKAVVPQMEAKEVIQKKSIEEQNNLINELDASMNAFRHVQTQVLNKVEADTQTLRDSTAADMATYDKLFAERREIARNAPESFFKNPLSYMATQIKLGFVDDKLNTIMNGMNVSRNMEDQAYAIAARDLSILRSKELAADFAASKIQYQNNMAQLGLQLTEIDTSLQQAEVMNRQSEQRNALNPKTEQDRATGRALAAMDSQAKFMYNKLHGNLKGYSSQVHSVAYAEMFKDLPQEQRVALQPTIAMFDASITAGAPMEAHNLLSYAITRRDMPGVLAYGKDANVKNGQAITYAFNQSYSKMFNSEVKKRTDEYLADEKNKSEVEDAGGEIPAAALKSIQQQAADELNGVRAYDVVQNAMIDVTKLSVNYTQNNARGALAGVANSVPTLLEVFRAPELDPRTDFEYFKSPEWATLMSGETPEFRQMVAAQGEWAAFHNVIWDGLERRGVNRAKIPVILELLTSATVTANALNHPTEGKMFRQFNDMGIDTIVRIPVLYNATGQPDGVVGYITDRADIQNMRAKTTNVTRGNRATGIYPAPPQTSLDVEHMKKLKELRDARAAEVEKERAAKDAASRAGGRGFDTAIK